MIERYSRKVMRELWTDQAKFEAYLKVEILNAKAWCELNVAPKDEVEKLEKNATFNLERIFEIEEQTRHDVVAFTRAVSESLTEESKWVHYGLTSTDVVDTANGYIIKKANDIIKDDLNQFLDVLKNQALKYQNTPCIGRTHGIHADITSFGLKWALWYEQMKRNIVRFNNACEEIEVGKLSGAVGNYANIPPFISEYVCDKLGIANANISTQVIQRDRHASYMSTLALIASSLEQIAVEIRSLQRTEIRELEESFGNKQKGSSAMPHKRNPISSENICGCARVMRGYATTFFENVALWHERDISHSSTERIILPDATCLIDYLLNRFKNVLQNIVVYEDQMLNNIYLTKKVIFSQRVMNLLIEEKKLVREKAYDLIQPISMNAYSNNLDFQELLKENKEILSYLTKEEIDSCFTLEYYMKNVEYIYKKVGLIK